MSRESVSTLELEKEIQECIGVHDELLQYSKQPGTLILPEANSTLQMDPLPLQQAANLPLPPQQRDRVANLIWNQEETTLLNEHILYHHKMIHIIEQAKLAGAVKKLPTPPKRKLREIFNEKLGKKKKSAMTPAEFHTYLQQHIQDMRCEISRKRFQFSNPENIQMAVEQLKDAYRHLCRQGAQSMLFNIQFGKYLEDLYNWFLEQKKAGCICIIWDKWLTSQISISSSHARKLRQLAKLLFDYPRFQHVNISLNEVLNKQSLIKEMLDIEEYSAFWKQVFTIPSEELLKSP